jgi:hypothetical protein
VHAPVIPRDRCGDVPVRRTVKSEAFSIYRKLAAAPEVATSLGYDVAAALEELDDG